MILKLISQRVGLAYTDQVTIHKISQLHADIIVCVYNDSFLGARDNLPRDVP